MMKLKVKSRRNNAKKNKTWMKKKKIVFWLNMKTFKKLWRKN